MQKLAETETGVYQPLSIKGETIPIVLLLLTLTILTLAGKIGLNVFFLLAVIMATTSLIRTAIELRKYGRLGKPILAMQAGDLVFTLTQDSRGRLSVPLSTLRETIIYGPKDRRYYRLIHEDGSFVEAAPLWSKSEDEAVIGFFQRRLSPAIKVTIKDPQSVFAYIRGDGP